jgi:hypothetical protein
MVQGVVYRTQTSTDVTNPEHSFLPASSYQDRYILPPFQLFCLRFWEEVKGRNWNSMRSKGASSTELTRSASWKLVWVVLTTPVNAAHGVSNQITGWDSFLHKVLF